MTSFFIKHYRMLYLLLPVLLGLALAQLVATALGISIRPPVQAPGQLVSEQPRPVRKPTIADYQAILDRNIFNAKVQSAASLTPAKTTSPEPVQTAPKTDLTLFGTVTRGDQSLAVIQAGKEIKTYEVGEKVPGGGTLDSVSRNEARIKYPDGSFAVLSLKEGASSEPTTSRSTSRTTGPTPSRTSTPSPEGGVQELGENRFRIPRQVAEAARGNINELLTQARMEPNIVNGKTQGFVVKMIQPRSLLSQLGIQRGDVVMQINGVEMDSPEKALQIFQQLRQARNISIGLLRNGQNLNFEYEIN